MDSKQFESKVRNLAVRILKEEGVKVKSKQDEELRMAAQELSVLKQHLVTIQQSADPETTVGSIIDQTLKHVLAASKSFSQLKTVLKR